MGRLLNVKQTAQRLAVHENTVRNWESRGLLRALRLPKSRHRRFDSEEVERLRNKFLTSEREPETGGARLSRVLRALQRDANRLRRMGVLHVAVFGSTARGEAAQQSDVDLLVELDPRKKSDIFDYAAIVTEMQRAVPFPVDAALKRRLKEHVAASALRDAVRAF